MRAGFTQTAKVNDAPHSGVVGSPSECEGELPVALSILIAGRHHRMHQVERRATRFQLTRERWRVGEIGSTDLNAGV
jgi:hypothetical protein